MFISATRDTRYKQGPYKVIRFPGHPNCNQTLKLLGTINICR